ncbi:MAG: chaperonin [Firmicutes bacterium]|nr:chaperonin [Bacillota bacterium]
MASKEPREESQVDDRMAALITNSAAVRAVVASVEGTIGPKGLDTMLVDKFGDVVITNDGCTILSRMEANHPAARMLINVAEAQQDEVGDGTTTASILAGALISNGVEQISRGVPVARVIEGIRQGVDSAIEMIKRSSRQVRGLDDHVLRQVALTSARGCQDLADLALQAARLVGEEKLRDPAFRLRDIIMAQEGAASEAFLGVVIDKGRMNKAMPRSKKDVWILILDDAMEPEPIESEALSTEAGFRRYLQLQESFKENLQKIIDLDIGLVVTCRGISEVAEEALVDAGIMAIERVSSREMRALAEHTGARPIKRRSLSRSKEEIRSYLGHAESVSEDERFSYIKILGGAGQPMATILVGAATDEVVGERERIAQDAASSVQAALIHGIVPGGGSIEIAAARALQKLRHTVCGMVGYGLDCVIDALKRPLSQIVTNAGFNALEKVEQAVSSQERLGKDSIGVDCDTGEIVDMAELGIFDPTLVKCYALKAAGEVAEAILRIDKIIRKREEQQSQ